MSSQPSKTSGCPSFVTGDLFECKTSLLTELYQDCPDYSHSLIEINAKKVCCDILFYKACMLHLILAYLKLCATIFTGAEQGGGVEIATNSKP